MQLSSVKFSCLSEQGLKMAKNWVFLPIEDTGWYHECLEVAVQSAAGQGDRVQLHDQPETCPG